MKKLLEKHCGRLNYDGFAWDGQYIITETQLKRILDDFYFNNPDELKIPKHIFNNERLRMLTSKLDEKGVGYLEALEFVHGLINHKCKSFEIIEGFLVCKECGKKRKTISL